MHLSPFHDPDLRQVHRSVRRGEPIPVDVQARLEARGVDVYELQERLIETQEYAG